MTNIYILSKRYHVFFFVFFGSLFIGGQKLLPHCCYVHVRKRTFKPKTNPQLNEMPYFV